MKTENKRESFVSPIFGPTVHGNTDDRAVLDKYAEEIPVTMFQSLNKAFQERGLMLSIGRLPEKLH